MSTAIDLTIIIPAYREAGIIVQSLQHLAGFLKNHHYGEVEVLVVVPDSPDGTVQLAKSQANLFKHFRVINAGPRVGKGRDVRIGIYEARGRYKLFMDADLATPLKHLDDVKALMDRGDKVGIAMRDLWRIHKGLVRKLISKSSNIAAQVILVPGIKDTQCGFKVFEASAAEAIFSRMTMLSWSFDAELLLIARQLDYHIVDIEAPDWADPKPAGSGLVGDSPIASALSGFGDLWKIRINAWRGLYKKPQYQHKSMY